MQATNSKQKNFWFFISGIISSVVAGIMYLASIIAIILSIIIFSADGITDITGSIPNDEKSVMAISIGVTVILVLIFVLVAIVNTICAKKCFDFAVLDREKLLEQKVSVIVVIVLMFLFCGTITGILSLLGFILKTEEINSSKSNATEDTSQKLDKAKKMYEDGIINEEEYKKIREKILNEI